jgi:hypothetical protein
MTSRGTTGCRVSRAVRPTAPTATLNHTMAVLDHPPPAPARCPVDIQSYIGTHPNESW